MAAAWAFSINLRKTIVAKNSSAAVDTRALSEVERLRNISESEMSNSLSFFLMGSTSLFDTQKKEKQALAESLASFENKFSVGQVPEILKRIQTLTQQEQEFFDQGMQFRAKQTEPKIVGQFYRAKIAPIKSGINKALDEITAVHKAEMDRAQKKSEAAAHEAEALIPDAMILLTALLSALFAAMAFLVLRMHRQRASNINERNRLYQAAVKASLTRDGILSAVSQDLTDPLFAITEATTLLKTSLDATTFVNGVGLIDSAVALIDDRVKDILDETKAETENLTLRVEQIGLDAILDEAQLMLEPFAKQKDVRLEFYPVNPPVLAFIDRERVMRVLTNLIGNAIKFSPRQSKVIIKVRSDQQFVFISVKDNGPGIPDTQLHEIFNHYWQAPKTADQGAGINMAVVKSIVEAHSGAVTVESHMGHGSTFTISLPRRRPAGVLLRKSAPPAVRFKSTPPQEPKFIMDFSP